MINENMVVYIYFISPVADMVNPHWRMSGIRGKISDSALADGLVRRRQWKEAGAAPQGARGASTLKKSNFF